jgi:dephospho-CoA kinase
VRWYRQKYGAPKPDVYAGSGWEILDPADTENELYKFISPLELQVFLRTNTMEENYKCIVFDAPQLFESKANIFCDYIVSVIADKNLRLERICKRDGIDEESAILRINAGKSDDFYLNNADFIIYNNTNECEFIEEFKKIICDIKIQ